MKNEWRIIDLNTKSSYRYEWIHMQIVQKDVNDVKKDKEQNCYLGTMGVILQPRA